LGRSREFEASNDSPNRNQIRKQKQIEGFFSKEQFEKAFIAIVRLRMAGWERGDEWEQCKRVQFVTHNLDGKAREAIALVIGVLSVVIGKVEVRWDVGGGPCFQ